MTEKNTYQEFDAATVHIAGSNLIEASAGTGKTYSIAILVLRLVLQQQLPLKQILMVTFTKAAVAELEERIRLFIRNAYKVSFGNEVGDNAIETLVLNAIDQSGIQPVQDLLREAILFLDETSVLTIHSFCQQTLQEFAFETNQLFGAEILQDISLLIEEEVNQFWRTHITIIEPTLLKGLLDIGLSRENIRQLVKEELSGKTYLGIAAVGHNNTTGPAHAANLQRIALLDQQATNARTALLQHISSHIAGITRATEANKHAAKNLGPLLDNPARLLGFIETNKDKAYIAKVYPDILDQLSTIEEQIAERNSLLQLILAVLHAQAIRHVKAGVQTYKQKNNLLSYDDMITNLHKALVTHNNPALIAALQNKYKAVFVDEFQDTDRQQYEIFEKAFGTNTILFYIGDPKQSIYAWRKADIFTYFTAREGVQHRYSMNKNYRSSAPFISAMNQFFQPTPDFDTFYFTNETDTISYIQVDSPPNNRKGLLYKNGEPAAPISINTLPKKETLLEAVATQVDLLLKNGSYNINGQRPVTPSDIGILVRTGTQGRDVKAQLAQLGIPAVTIDDSRVLQTAEARYLLYLMEAMAAPDRSSINRALLSPFTSLTRPDILLLNDEATLNLFSAYKQSWQSNGIYTALMDFIADFGVRQVLLQTHTENGERVITNLFQLTELVHQVQSRKNLSPAELISWLKRGLNGMATEGDQYEQRVESDEDSVKIVTIHKSKGLEYNIVLAPFLDFVEHANQKFASFRDPRSGNYVSVEKKNRTEEQAAWDLRQSEQENRRLLYVAITRAVYSCFIFHNSYYKKSTLAEFLNVLQTQAGIDTALIRFESELPEAPAIAYKSRQAPTRPLLPPQVHFELQHANWRKMSYTMLAAKPAATSRPYPQQLEEAYDTFIFHTMRRGAKTGNLLHYIFENIRFSDDARWEYVFEEAIRRFVPGQHDRYQPMLRQLVDHALHTTIHIGDTQLQLSSISHLKRIAEFEFDFPVPLFSPDRLNNLSDAGIHVNIKNFLDYSNQLEGIMNGKMDLFFEHAGKYYILDWKSNYLGNTPEDYTPQALAIAMNDSNYHLQYLLYTLAATKYLQSRLPHFEYDTQFGGVIYLFIRGMRKESSQGIYTTRPSWEKIHALNELLS